MYSMNHCQFLTYGLLKLFLKEVINHQPNETNELLCSYHMKTTVFWAIQQNTLPHCCPQNLLVGFWVCIKLLLKWVYEGFCPNFFIPQNNLFLSKLYGSAQSRLFLQLHELYKKGFQGCLLQCSTLRSHIIDALCNPRLSICMDEIAVRFEVEHDEDLFHASHIFRNLLTDWRPISESLFLLEQLNLKCLLLTQYQTVHLQKLTVAFLQNTATALLHGTNNVSCCNKRFYIATTCVITFLNFIL